MDHSEISFVKQESLNYFTYLVEDRMGLGAEITKSNNSLTVNLTEDASVEPVQAHSFCMNLMVSLMYSFGVFVPFKVYDQKGNLITLETNATDIEFDTISPDSPFIVNEDEEEEFYNFG